MSAKAAPETRFKKTTNSTVLTNGVYSHGIVAQSISAGGGLVDVTTVGLNGGNLNAQLILGGSVSGNSGSVSVSSGANITTNGAIADGILAELTERAFADSLRLRTSA